MNVNQNTLIEAELVRVNHELDQAIKSTIAIKNRQVINFIAMIAGFAMILAGLGDYGELKIIFVGLGILVLGGGLYLFFYNRNLIGEGKARINVLIKQQARYKELLNIQ